MFLWKYIYTSNMNKQIANKFALFCSIFDSKNIRILGGFAKNLKICVDHQQNLLIITKYV